MYQKCPICNGDGKVLNLNGTVMFSVCSTCNGTKIIDSVTGLPPQQVVQLTPKAFEEHYNTIGKQFNPDIEK